MKLPITLSMLALAAFAAGMTAFQAPADAYHRHRGRNIAIGIGAAAATAIILSEAARAERRRGYRYSCAELYDRCDAGSNWACERYERRCE